MQSKGLSRVFADKVSILRCSVLFIAQLSHPHMTTGKTIALTRWTFVGKAMSLLFNMLSRLVIAFLPKSKRLLISRLQSPSAVLWEPPIIKSLTVFTSTDMSLSKLGEMVKEREAWHAAGHGVSESDETE